MRNAKTNGMSFHYPFFFHSQLMRQKFLQPFASISMHRTSFLWPSTSLLAVYGLFCETIMAQRWCSVDFFTFELNRPGSRLFSQTSPAPNLQ